MALELVKAAYRFLRFSVPDFKPLWNWSTLFTLLADKTAYVTHETKVIYFFFFSGIIFAYSLPRLLSCDL